MKLIKRAWNRIAHTTSTLFWRAYNALINACTNMAVVWGIIAVVVVALVAFCMFNPMLAMGLYLGLYICLVAGYIVFLGYQTGKAVVFKVKEYQESIGTTIHDRIGGKRAYAHTADYEEVR